MAATGRSNAFSIGNLLLPADFVLLRITCYLLLSVDMQRFFSLSLSLSCLELLYTFSLVCMWSFRQPRPYAMKRLMS